MPRTARQRRTLHRRIRTIAVLAVASGGTAAWLVTHNHTHRVKTVPAAAVSELVIPGLERLPDLATTERLPDLATTTTTVPVTTTTVTVAAPVYHPPVTVPTVTTAQVARAVPPSRSPVRATTTMAPATTTARTPVVAAAITSCGAYPFTVCIPPVGSPARWSCVILKESGGNPRAVGRLGEGGLFQLMVGTAAGLGFPPLQFQPILVQIKAATALYLQRGFQPWSPSDGC